MRIFLSLIIAFSVLFISIPRLSAFTVTEWQDKGIFTTGFEGKYLRHKGKLHEYTYTRNDSSGKVIKQGGFIPGEDIQDVEGESYLALASMSYNVTDNLEIFLQGGGVLSDWQLDWYENNVEMSRTNIESDWGVAAGGGVKSRILKFKGNWEIGVSLSYLLFLNGTTEYTKRHDSGIKYQIEDWAVIEKFWEGVDSVEYKDGQKIHQWETAIYLSKRLNNLQPYIGVKYFDFRNKYEAKLEGFNSSGTLIGKEKRIIETKSDGNVGVFAGINYQLSEDFILGLEGTFIDEITGEAGLTLIF